MEDEAEARLQVFKRDHEDYLIVVVDGGLPDNASDVVVSSSTLVDPGKPFKGTRHVLSGDAIEAWGFSADTMLLDNGIYRDGPWRRHDGQWVANARRVRTHVTT